MSKSAIQYTLEHWLEVAEHFEQGIISERTFLRAQAGAMETASKVIPRNAKEATTQLMFAVLLWKEEVTTPTIPTHIAMDKMLDHVMDFLQELK